MSTQKPEGKSKGRGPNEVPGADSRKPPAVAPPAPPAARRGPPPPAEPGPARRASADDPVDEFLSKARKSRGGPALEALERAAQLLESRGEPEQAIWRLEEALRRSSDGPVEPRLVARLAVALALAYETHLGRLDRAVELLEQAHKLAPDQPHAIEAGRRIYGAVGDLQRVARLYEIELETAPSGSRPRRVELLLALADTLLRIGDATSAATRLEQALPLADATQAAAIRERLASLYSGPAYADQAGDAGSGAGLARAAVLFRELAVERHRANDPEGEIACYRRALGAAPADLEAAIGLEAAYRSGGLSAELVRLYQQAPWLPGAARHLAELALAGLGQAIPSGSPASVAHSHAGRVTQAMDAVLAAASAGEDVHDLLPILEVQLSRPEDHVRLASLYQQLLQLTDDADPLARADRLVLIAKHHKLGGEPLRFESALLDALAAFPGHEEGYGLLAEHLGARRDYATLVAVAEAALAAAPTDEHAERLEDLAELYDKRLGDVTGAVDAWTRRLSLGRSDRAESELRRLRIKEDRWAGLVASLERELELATSPDVRAEVLRRLGQIHRERHDLDRARALFSDALDLRPSDPSLYRTLGELAELEGRFDELVLLLRRQYRAAKERVEKLNLLRRLAALYEERLGDWDGVEWACEEILTHLPSDRDALRRLEQCHEGKGPAGVEALLHVLEAHAQAAATPIEKIELYRRLARQYESTAQLDLAADRWERVVRLDKTDAEATRALALTYEALDRPADAALAYARLLEQPRGQGGRPADALSDGDRADAWRRYARILDQRLPDPTRARAAWEQLLVLRPADRDALAALMALHRQRGDAAAVEALLTRRLSIAEGIDRAPLALELVRVQLARRAHAEAGARIQELLSSLSLEALAGEVGDQTLTLAVELAETTGDARAALRALEQRYFATDAQRRPALALQIAERWGQVSPSGPATLLAWERVRALTPTDPRALAQLSERYAAAGLPDSQREIDLARLDLAESSGDRIRAVELGEGLARLVEEQLGDPRAAFFQLERVIGAPDMDLHARVLDGLRALAMRGGLFGELARVLADEPGLAARVERAQLFEERLREPRRAFEIIRAAVSPEIFPTLGAPSAAAAILVPHVLRLGERAQDVPGVLEALRDLIPALPRIEQARLLALRAEVLERRAKDLPGALDELLRSVPLVEDGPDADALDTELRRLALATRRHEDLLALLAYRAARAPRGSTLRSELLDEAAMLVEAQLRSPLRSFRLRLTVLAQLADPLTPPIALRDEVWRLARLVDRSSPSFSHTAEDDPTAARTRIAPLAPRVAAPASVSPSITEPPPIIASARPDRDSTLEVDVRDVVVESSQPRRDSTLEVDVRDVVVESSQPRRDATMEIQLGDLAEVVRGAPPPRPSAPSPRGAPPPLPGMRSAPPPMPPRRPPPALSDVDGAWLLQAPSLDQPLVRIDGEHSSWDELSALLLRSERVGNRPTARARLAVATMWEQGATRIERAFDELHAAFLGEPGATEAAALVHAALDALALRHGAEDRLVEILDEAVEVTASSDRAIELLLESAAIRERQSNLDDAEARYRRILGIRPGMPEATDRLESQYRQSGRWEALAELLERRLNGLLERMPSGPARGARAMELAEVYERLAKPYEAIGTLEALIQRDPEHAGALTMLARLYEAQGQWGKVVESLARRIDLLEAGDGSATQPEARRLRLRIARIYESEIEVPERALEAYRALDRAGLPDPEVEASLARLLTQLGHPEELSALYGRQLASSQGPPEDRVALAHKRVALLRGANIGGAAFVAALRELLTLSPNDDEALVELDTALSPDTGALEERIALIARRLQLAEASGAPPRACASLLAQLGTLEAAAGRKQEAIHTLEQAVALAPEDPSLLAELARVREGGEDWHGYAEARERQAEAAGDDAAATRALVDAARAQLEHGGEQARAHADAERALARCPEEAGLLREVRALFVALDDQDRVLELLRREIALSGEAEPARADLLCGLGTHLLAKGDVDGAGLAFRDAHEAQPGHALAVHGLTDVAARTGAWDEVEPILRYAATAPGVIPSDAAAFFRRIAEAAAARGNSDDAYAALIEADRRQPGDLRTRVQLGRNRYAQSRFREAAQHLGAVADHADLPRLGIAAAQALYEGAISELKIKRPERAERLLLRALVIDPQHALALGLLATHTLERGDTASALDLLERQAQTIGDSAERAGCWERIGAIARDQLNDPGRASTALTAAVVAWEACGGEARPPLALLEALLTLERSTNQITAAAATAARLLQYSAAPTVRARRLRESASLEAAIGHEQIARERLAAAHELDPGDPGALADYAALLVKDGDEEAGAQLLTRALAGMPPPTEAERPARAALWQRLGELRDRLRDSRGALAALERVLELDPSRRALRLSLLERYGEDPAHEAVVAGHRRLMLEADPLDLPSLRALERIETRAGRAERAAVLQTIQSVAGALAVGRPIPIQKPGPTPPLSRPGATMVRPLTAPEGLGESELLLLEHPDATALSEVFAAIYEGIPQDQLADLAVLGVVPEGRVSPVGGEPAADVFAECARLLGNKRAALYFKDDPTLTAPMLMVRPPTAVVLSPALASLPTSELRFLLGRALWLLRAEHALIVGLPRDRLNSLFMSTVRAFHPRHASSRGLGGEVDAVKLRKELPYKVVRRLSELFQRENDTGFSSARWRRGVEHSANRAGLVACGDFRAAARVLRDEGDDGALRELARFTLSDAYLTLRGRTTAA